MSSLLSLWPLYYFIPPFICLYFHIVLFWMFLTCICNKRFWWKNNHFSVKEHNNKCFHNLFHLFFVSCSSRCWSYHQFSTVTVILHSTVMPQPPCYPYLPRYRLHSLFGFASSCFFWTYICGLDVVQYSWIVIYSHCSCTIDVSHNLSYTPFCLLFLVLMNFSILWYQCYCCSTFLSFQILVILILTLY